MQIPASSSQSVMEDVFQEIEICFRNRLKEITAHNGNPLLKTESRSLGTCTRDNLWAIEHDTVKVQMKPQQGMKHRATSAADIGHSVYTTRVDKSCRFLCDSGCQTRHRLGEGGGLSGVCRKIFKQPRAKRWNRLAFSRFDSLSETPPWEPMPWQGPRHCNCPQALRIVFAQSIQQRRCGESGIAIGFDHPQRCAGP